MSEKLNQPSWYKLETSEALSHLGSDAGHGLSEAEAARRLAQYGPNELVERGAKSPWRILWEQFTATMVVILIVAAVIAGALGEFKDTIAIMSIVVLFGLLGFLQEYRAEKAMAALKKLAVPNVRVTRDGQVRETSARDLVPGDVILLEAGNLLPADCRLLESANLRIQEATLTGESEPVEKEITTLAGPDLPLGDRRNMAYMGTVVTYGRGRAVITATGMQTELGHIAGLIQGVAHEQTPLQRRLDQVGKMLALVALAIAGVIFVQGWLRGEELRLIFLTMVSIAVAIIPEGLPAVVTITLALGAQRMLKRQALIRKLPAVETLGSVTVICSDKTGTLTENRMTVTVIDVAGHRVDLNEDMRHHVPAFDQDPASPPQSQPIPMRLLLAGGALCNDALLKSDNGSGGHFHAIGDPTEGALVVAAAKFGLWKADLDQALPRVAEAPFDSERKRMTTVHSYTRAQLPEMLQASASLLAGTPYVAFTKGSVDGLLEIATHVWVDNQTEALTDSWRSRIEAANMKLAQNGMRVLGVACRPLEALPTTGQPGLLEQNLTFLGLVGIIDPPRPEVKEAVATCQAAGIRPIMITGDHPLTAQHIASELGITSNGRVLTGQDLAKFSVEELREVVESVSVYARVSPEHKLKVVQALQDRGHVVAMTGDGVNDAPALKKADIGVAMGITGTDVSKEAADMVLRDDNFATIVAAVEEGRVIYDNLRKFIKFSIAGNIGKVAVMLFGPLLAFLVPPEMEKELLVPLLPLQLLWLNLLTDGLLGLGLGVEPAEKNTMRRPPRAPSESIFAHGLGWHILRTGLLIAIIALAVGYWYDLTDRAHTQTMIFTTLALAQIWQALGIRSGQDSLFTVGLFSNKPLLGAAVLVFVLQLAVLYTPFLQEFFQTRPLLPVDLGISIAISCLVFIVVEVEKWLARRKAA
ncbi:MAG: cation-translocating P-type ATPase [Anaerolineales bacterium]|nr:cation-translocating P-type ATPase [Anaerolineales bacterium]